jgi:hypothetical protein
MKRVTAMVVFAYGSTATVVLVLCLIVALFGSAAQLEPSSRVLAAILAMHGTSGLLTFTRYVDWEPLFALTEFRQKVARRSVWFAFAVFCALFVTFALAGAYKNQQWLERLTPVLALQAFLVQTLYIAVHWAFRPENVFPERLRQVLSNPFGEVLLYLGCRGGQRLPPNKRSGRRRGIR